MARWPQPAATPSRSAERRDNSLPGRRSSTNTVRARAQVAALRTRRMGWGRGRWARGRNTRGHRQPTTTNRAVRRASPDASYRRASARYRGLENAGHRRASRGRRRHSSPGRHRRRAKPGQSLRHATRDQSRPESPGLRRHAMFLERRRASDRWRRRVAELRRFALPAKLPQVPRPVAPAMLPPAHRLLGRAMLLQVRRGVLRWLLARARRLVLYATLPQVHCFFRRSVPQVRRATLRASFRAELHPGWTERKRRSRKARARQLAA